MYILGALDTLVNDVGSIFQFSMENGLLGFVTGGVPQVHKRESNPKKVCYTFIKKRKEHY